ncbi:MAG: thiolase [Rhodospirillales bacterium]|nr:thiolase [Rhodospirillales bacterium]
MKHQHVAVVGAAETTEMGVIPNLTELQLHADAALNALADAGLTTADIDGIACAGVAPDVLASYLGVTPTWIDGTHIGGSSFMLHVRHAMVAIQAGHCKTVIITHGESGRSAVGAAGFPEFFAGRLGGEFEVPYGGNIPPTMFTIPALRYLKEFDLTIEDLAQVAVAQRKWAALNPRATFKDPITIDDVLNSKMIAYPFTLLMCCLRTDGGGALILTFADRGKDFSQPPVYILGTGESCEGPMISQMEDYTTSRAFRVAGEIAFAEAGIERDDVDHVMIYDAFAHVPLYGLEDLGFCKPGEAAGFIRDGHTSLGGKLPTNTNGGGLSYMHSGMYGMYAMQESVRQIRGLAPAQVPGAKISVALGIGGMFSVSGTIIFGNELP